MPIRTIWTATWIVINTFTQDVWIKSFWAIIIIFIDKLIIWKEFWIFLMFLIYFLDFILWLIVAFKLTSFNLWKFFFWSSKILIYWIYLLMWVALWEILQLWSFFTLAIITFTIVTDSISILRKIDNLWYETPVFLTKYLISYKKNLEDEKFWK